MKDLHIHTIYSDGELDVLEVTQKIKELGVDFFSITDHNTIDGCKKIVENNIHRDQNFKFVTGIELSAKIDKGNCHILGYNIDIYDKYLNDKLLELAEMCKYNILLVVNYLKEHFGINLPASELEVIFDKEGSVNNVQLSKLLVKLGYCQTSMEAFSKYIKIAKEKIRDKKHEFSPIECIKIIKEAGGVPVLAHNYQLKMDYMELKAFLTELKKHGLMGLECYHSGFSLSGCSDSLDLAKSLDLLVTGGSDYHGPNVKPDIEIGSGKNHNLDITELSIEKYLSKKIRY